MGSGAIGRLGDPQDRVRGRRRRLRPQGLAEKLKTLKASFPDQSAITVQPEDAIAYDDLVSTLDICLGEQLRNVTVAPLN